MRIALQMYSLRDMMKADPRGTIRLAGGCGFDGVELAGTFGIEAAEMRDLLEEAGLELMGSHVSFDALRDDIRGQIAYARAVGAPAVVCPMMHADSAIEWRAFARDLEQYARMFDAVGITFGYHNHAQEFERFADGYALDIVLGAAPSIFCELDVHWVAAAGLDVVSCVRERRERIRLLHAKDIVMSTGEEVEVGTGDLDFAAIAAAATHCEWMVVEHEAYRHPALDSVRIGLENLRGCMVTE